MAPDSFNPLRALPRATPETHRSTLDPDRGYYGELPVGLRCSYRAPVAEDDVAVINACWLDGAATLSSDPNGHPIREQNSPISFEAPSDHCVRHTAAVPGNLVLGCEAIAPRALTRRP
jgi:hypothetical protein